MSKELKTNLDRIRAMSLEELSEFLKGYDIDDAGINFCSANGCCPHAKECFELESRSECFYFSGKPVSEGHRVTWEDWLKQEWKDAPAGSGEPSEEDDLISRTAAINEARWVNTDGGRFEVVHIETLLTLPAIKTEHVGHWINDSGPLKCSECGTSFPDLYPDYEKSVACPHCGAPIRGERDV